MKINYNPILSLLFISLVCTGYSSAEIIPPDRRIDWSAAGIPGGIPDRTIIFTTIDSATYGNGTTNATAVIQKAIDSCPDNQVAYIPGGTYAVSQTVHLYTRKTLRGAGMGKTIINYTDTSGRSVLDMRGSINWDITGLQRSFSITGGMTKGSTQIVLNNASGISTGDILLIDQLNDGQMVDPVGFEGLCTYCGRLNGARTRGQLAEVKAVTGATVTLNIPLLWTLSSSLSPEATLVNARSMVRWAGIEDLTISETYPATEFMIEMDGAQYSWLKNVEIKRIKRRAVWLIESLQNEIRLCYFHDGIGGFGRDRGYGVLADNYATANLIEDNIFHTLDGGFMMTAGGASGNVFGYNYMIDSRFDDSWWLTCSPSINHAPHPCMNLWEGNIGIQAAADFIHGSSSHNTMFRCRFSGWQNSTITANNNAIEIQYKNTCMNVVGCVLGTAGQSGTYEAAFPATADNSLKTIWRLGYGGPAWAGDTNVKATLLRHGNFDYMNNNTLWDPNISDHELPKSLYLNSKPAFFGTLPWPPIGPDMNPMTGMLPAQVRYLQMITPVKPPQKTVPGNALFFTAIPSSSGRYVTVSFTIASPSPVSVRIYRPDGKQVKNLLDLKIAKVSQVLRWDLRDDKGRITSCGAYLVVLKSKDLQQTKMIEFYK